MINHSSASTFCLQDRVRLPYQCFYVELHRTLLLRALFLCDGASWHVFSLALADRSSSSRRHILSTFDQSSVRPFPLSSSSSSIPMASHSAWSIDLTNSTTLSAPTSLCFRSGSRAKRRPNSRNTFVAPLWVFADATQWSKSCRFRLLSNSPYAHQTASSKVSHKPWASLSSFTYARIRGATTRQKNSNLNASFTPCTSTSAL